MKRLSYLILLILLAACSDETVSLIESSDAISFGMDISDEWMEAGSRTSFSSDTLFHSIEEIPGTGYMLETVTLRGIGDEQSSDITRGIQIDKDNFSALCKSFSLFSTAEESLSGSNSHIFIDNEKIVNITPAGSGQALWTASSDRYWPEENYNLSFFAVAPYIENETVINSGPVLLSVGSDSNNIEVSRGVTSSSGNYSVEKDPENSSWTLNYTMPDDARNHMDIIAAIGRESSDDNSPAVFPGNYHKPVFLRFKHLMAAVQVRAVASDDTSDSNDVPDPVKSVFSKVSFGNVIKSTNIELNSLGNYLPASNDNSRGLVLAGSNRGTTFCDLTPEIDLAESGKTNLVDGDATFLMIPQPTNGLTLSVNCTEDDADNTNGPLTYTFGSSSHPWIAGTTTIYTIFPKTITLRLKNLDGEIFYTKQKNTFSLEKAFEIPDNASQLTLPPEADPVMSYDDYPDKGAYEFIGWIPEQYWYKVNADAEFNKIPEIVKDGESFNLSESTTYRPIFRFNSSCKLSIFLPYEGRETSGVVSDRRPDHFFSNTFINQVVLHIGEGSAHNRVFFKHIMIDGELYDCPCNYTLRTTFKNAYYVLEGRFNIVYDTSALGEEMPIEEQNAFNGGDVEYFDHPFEVSSWKKGEIIWRYDGFGKFGKPKDGAIEPGGIITVDEFRSDTAVLHAEPI